ncbi:MAG: hypothetical protein LBO05_11525 [Deltaproteobacteria bacterium]|nr:hypothetical protein [Deltaproteobacteria bacterium]
MIASSIPTVENDKTDNDLPKPTQKRGRLSKKDITAEREVLFALLDNGSTPLEAGIKLHIPKTRFADHMENCDNLELTDRISCLLPDLPMVLTNLPGGHYTKETGFVVELIDEKIVLIPIKPDKQDRLQSYVCLERQAVKHS